MAGDGTATGFGMTDLEERLGGPQGRDVQERTTAMLADRAQRLRALMDAGLPPNEFRKASAAHAALEAAFDIVSRFPAGSQTRGQ